MRGGADATAIRRARLRAPPIDSEGQSLSWDERQRLEDVEYAWARPDSLAAPSADGPRS